VRGFRQTFGHGVGSVSGSAPVTVVARNLRRTALTLLCPHGHEESGARDVNVEVDAFFCQAQWLLRWCSQLLCDRARKERYVTTFQLTFVLTALYISHQATAGLIKPGHSRAIRLRTDSCSCIRADSNSAASSAALGGSHAQPFARAFATGPTSGQAKSRPGRAPKASPPWLINRDNKAPSAPDFSRQTPSNVARQGAAAPEPGLHAKPEHSQARQANAAPGLAETQAKYAVNSKSSTAQQSAATSSQETNAERRQRSLSGSASTSAAATVTSINEATYGTAKDDLKPAQQTSAPPASSGMPYHSTAAADVGHTPAQQAFSSNYATVNPHQSPTAQQMHSNRLSHLPNAGATVTSRQPSRPLPQPPSAPSNGSSHLPGSSDAISAQSSASEPSQYAQKEVQFDVAASRKQGGNAIRDLLETQKITLQEYAPGQKPKTRCPRCHGGTQHEDSLAVNISVDSQSAAWKCHRATCGWEGGIDQKAGV